MPHLPRVPAFPISGERSIITAAGAALKIPAKEIESPLIGEIAPEIFAQDHLGRNVSLHATIELGRPIVLYFFPLAGSPHCTKESCSFRDAVGTSPIFNDLNAVVIGISQDPPSRSRKFVDEHHLGFRILHDRNRQIMNTYGVGRSLLGMIDGRCTFIIDQAGVVRAMLDGVWDYKGHRDFAEKWLCRIEHELSGRERFYLEHDADDSVACDEGTRNVRVVYGDAVPGRAIATAPRFGAAPSATKSRSSSNSTKAASSDSKSATRSSLSEREKASPVPRVKSRRNLKNWLRPSPSSPHGMYDEPLHVDYKHVNRSADDVMREQRRGGEPLLAVRSTDKAAARMRSGLAADHAAVISRDFAELGLHSRSREGSGSGYATPSTISARSVSTGETSHTSPGPESHATKLAAAIKNGIATGPADLERSGSSRRRVPTADTAMNGIAANGMVRPKRSSSLLKQKAQAESAIGDVSLDTIGGRSSDGFVYANGNIAKMPLLPSVNHERSTDSKATVIERRGGGDSSVLSNASSLPVPPRPTTRNGVVNGAVGAAASARLPATASPTSMNRVASVGNDAEEDDGYDTDRAPKALTRHLPPQSPAPTSALPVTPSASLSFTNFSHPSPSSLRNLRTSNGHPSPSPSLTNNFFAETDGMDRRLSNTPSLTPSQFTSVAGSEFEYSPSLAGSTHTFGGDD